MDATPFCCNITKSKMKKLNLRWPVGYINIMREEWGLKTLKN